VALLRKNFEEGTNGIAETMQSFDKQKNNSGTPHKPT